ncbi:CinA family nicotinamide mononucleotide deamidase-related protein [Aquimarina aquimarini]|uniref:CinA family nicotinamide mononucleotide deamidase-related protein n=1 Tax=Aquimarina aquimarini TaxID=1191734 RepID=UPI000D55DFA3|nr:CinA family nicotinamide mononucleotide deamidase-related protein [Aquimarina aquimarini]
MYAEIITIGDEILIGQIVDSNSAFMGKELSKIGVDVCRITSIKDEKEDILNALQEASSRADVILITGGLGPTKDDITKHTLCEYFNDTLVLNKEVLTHVEELFAKYISIPISEVNKQQALVPSTATVLMNQYGTAPGMWLEKDNKVFISMPGVPYEMKGLMKDEVLPRIQKRFKRPYIIHKTILTHGMGESLLAEKIEDWENDLPQFIKLAYLPSLGRVRLRLSAKGTDEKLLVDTINSNVIALDAIIGDVIVGYEEDQTIEKGIGKLLVKQNKTLSVAESCTGGMIAHSFTINAGASAYFNGGVVTYATQSKVDILGVDADLIKTYTVTSTEVAEAMALKVKEKMKTDYAIATTGNAGPTRGDGDVEVGTVFIAIATPEGVFSEKHVFSNLRERTIGKTVNKSLELLYNELLK